MPIKDIFLFDHLDCGAYKYLHPKQDVRDQYYVADAKGMTEFHRHELNRFAWNVTRFIDKQRQSAEAELDAARNACGATTECWERVKKEAKEKAEAWTDIRVSCFVMDLLGKVTQLDVPTEQQAALKC